MRFLKRFAVLVVVVVLAAAGAAVWWLASRLDAVVASTIEETGSALLGVDVSVGGVEVDLAAGTATLRQLAVANPHGDRLTFSSRPAFALRAITVAIDVEALDLQAIPQGAAPIPLTLVRVTEPVVNAEVTKAGINLEILKRQLDAAPPTPDSGPEVRIRIDRFEFAEGALNADTTQVGGDLREIALPALVLRRLGGEAGAPADVIGGRILDAFLSGAIDQVARDRLGSEVEKRLDEVKEKAAGALRSILGVEERDPD